MIDVQIIRNDLNAVAKKLATRGYDLDTAQFKELEAKRKDIQGTTEYYQSQRNALSKQIGQAKAKGDQKLVDEIMAEVAEFGNKLKKMESELKKVQEDLQDFLSVVPNIPHESVPVGKSPADNPERRRQRTPRKFDFPVKDHVEVGEGLAGLDFAAGTKIAGARFVVMRGEVARLHRALVQFMLDVHTREHGYTEIYTPYLVNSDTAYGTGQLPKFEQDLFKVPFGLEEPTVAEQEHIERAVVDSLAAPRQRYLYLIPTAEVPVTNLVRDEIVPLEKLPLQFVCHSPCFRSEAGSYGKDTRGMIRNHQFDKVELVQIVHPAKSYKALEELTGHAEVILRKLELPYRVVELCTADIGAASAKTYDLEVWLPAQNTYREISSCSNCEAYQARRMQARFRNEKGKPELVHTLNGSGLAVGRTLVAILENFQNADGSVSIPAALRPYMNGADRIAKA